MKKTGFIWDESYLWHSNGDSALMLPAGGLVEKDIHAENAETKRRVKNLLERSKYIKQLECIDPREATEVEIKYVHSPEYIKEVKKVSENGGGGIGNMTYVGPDSFEIASLAIGGALSGVDAVMEGKIKNAYVLTRPPGHHAEKDYGSGFCLFNNVAIAAHYARKTYGIDRIMIVDWDVHHGNGTESAFYDDPNTLVMSLHQEYVFPAGRGNAEDVGTGKAQGHNINIPLPAGTADEGYLTVLEELVVPIAEQFKPEFIFISAGQDPSRFDPLGRMLMTAEGFEKMTNVIIDIANRYAKGRLVACHEGGYSSAYVPFCTLKIIEALNGIPSNVKDPFPEDVHGAPMYYNQRDTIEKVKRIQSDFWQLTDSTTYL